MNQMITLRSIWHARLLARFGSVTACLAVADHWEQHKAPARAIPLLARAAKAGSAHAKMRLGKAYLTGPGVPPHMGQALRWLHEAAEGGDTDAQTQLAELALQGVTRSGHGGFFSQAASCAVPDWNEAVRYGQAASAAGSAQAKALLAFILTEGPIPLRDAVEAEDLYRQAAAAGLPRGQLGLALTLLKRGEATEARILLRAAAGPGLPIAHYWLAMLSESGAGGPVDQVDAAEHYRLAAEGGCVPAQTRFGIALLYGRGAGQDRFSAETWLRRAAIAGDIQAAAIMGVIAADESCEGRNSTEAVAWLERSAEAGHAGAARSLAQLYRLGQGVPKDLTEARRWLRAAAVAGDAGARSDLAALALTGHADPADRVAAARWLLEAAQQGDTGALFKLGLCMATGMAVRQNAALARRCYLAAAARGQPDAAAAAGEMLVNGRGGPADRQSGIVLLRRAAARGHSGAKYALGVLLSDADLLQEAADDGHPQARIMLQQRVPA